MSLIVIYQCPHRTLSRSPALAPSVTSFSTVLAILFLVAMYNALNLSLSCVDAGGYQIHVHVRVLRTPISSFLHLHISLPLPSPPPTPFPLPFPARPRLYYLPAPHTPLTPTHACSVTCASRKPASFVANSISSAFSVAMYKAVFP